MSEVDVAKVLSKRLMPLFVAAFFQSFVFWYTVEKLFMRSIGFTNTDIGFMVAVYSAVMLLVDTPSGILADRWSRKGVLMLASVCLALSAIAGGLSHGIGGYLICAVLWGIFFACYSGMYDSIIYDTLSETAPGHDLYDRYYGRIQFLDSLGLVISSLIGGYIAARTNLRAVYFLTVPIALLPVAALARFKEPSLHKQGIVPTLPKQLKATLKAITTNRSLLPVARSWF